MPNTPKDRAFLAVQLFLAGDDITTIASKLPRQDGSLGVSEKSAEIILRSGMRTLLSCTLRGHRPAGLPDDLWPPEHVREDIRESMGTSWRVGLKALRSWVLSQRPHGQNADSHART